MHDPFIKINDFSKSYGPVNAVTDLNLEIEQGECYALLGPNGSGKSTIIRSLVGLILPTKGEIYFEDTNTNALSRDQMRRIAYLPQRISLPSKLSAYEVLDMFARLRNISSDEVNNVLKLVGLEQDANRYINQFSGGMLQRLGLATVLMVDAWLIVLDEPTLNLDPFGREIFRKEILKRKNSGTTIIITSHIVQDAEELADRVGIMVNGKLEVEASIHQFRHQLTEATRVRVIMRETNDLMKEAAQLAGASLVDYKSEILMFTAPSDLRLTIIHAIEKVGGEILEFHSESPDWTSLIGSHINETSEQ
ncbi:ABC transporter ATP-binding protein [Calditrichota bacterium]